MHKAFLFDMDGVLVDSERFWGPIEIPFLHKIFGAEVAEQIGQPVGMGLEAVYAEAIRLGAKFDRDEFLHGYEEVAMKVYDIAPITEGVATVAEKAINLGYKLGVVTQSPQTWLDRVIPQLPFKNSLEVIISLRERSDLRLKPAPDGFLEAFKQLNSEAKSSVVLEDSNTGIAGAKASGAYVIGYSGNLVDGYKQEGADVYADTMEEVANIVATRQSLT